MNYWITPIVSAIIGWLGIWTAVKLLIYRIIPSHKEELAGKLAKAVSTEFSLDEVEKKIVDPENIKKVMPVVEEHIDDFLRNKLKEKMPVISMFIGDKTINNLKEVFLKEIEDLFPQVLKRFTANLQSQLDIETLVANIVTSVSAGQLDKALSPAVKYLQLAGAITGLAIGLIDVLLFMIVK